MKDQRYGSAKGLAFSFGRYIDRQVRRVVRPVPYLTVLAVENVPLVLQRLPTVRRLLLPRFIGAP